LRQFSDFKGLLKNAVLKFRHFNKVQCILVIK
jgi:hypothetical protein